jgi:16S rRNA A1518/A1519 N6-dimethyltransferase RsmA/KsgA/DIM1 with predicted DNA glycosylase/AP lyase activity
MAIVEDPENHELAALSAMVPSFTSRRVLEIGCGDGRLTRQYAGAAASVIAIDPDADAIVALRDELPQVEAHPIGIGELVLPAHSVDIALFSWSL